jgi:hypothetical protein
MIRLPPRSHAVLAWSLWALWLGLSVAAVRWSPPGDPGGSEYVVGLLGVGYATVGALVAHHRARNPVGWLMLLTALAFAVEGSGEAFAVTGPAAVSGVVGWTAAWVWFAWVLLIGVFLPLVFPDGRLVSRRWLPVVWLGLLSLVMAVLSVALRPGRLDLAVPTKLRDPFAVRGVPASVFVALETAAGALVTVVVVATAVSLVVRFRRSAGAERQQLKWFAFPGVVTLVGFSFAGVQSLMPEGFAVSLGSVGWFTFMVGALVGLPLGTAFAIFRYHLYDIDLVINRALVYTVLTAVLLATYVVASVLLGRVLAPVTGGSDLAVAGSTLIAAAAFRPARRRIQGTVDRHFYRRRYDAHRTLDTFTARLRHELDLDAVGTDLCATARDTVQPTHVSLWIRS